MRTDILLLQCMRLWQVQLMSNRNLYKMDHIDYQGLVLENGWKLGSSNPAETLNVKAEDGKTQNVSRQEDGCRTPTELRRGEAVQAGPKAKEQVSRQNREEVKDSEKQGSSVSAAMKMAVNKALEKITHETEVSQQHLKEEKRRAMEMGI